MVSVVTVFRFRFFSDVEGAGVSSFLFDLVTFADLDCAFVEERGVELT